MGTGKTTIAQALSGQRGMPYVSTDDMIEASEKMSISEIFAKKGEAYFRQAEKNTVDKAASMDNAVIDTGGGVVINEENVKRLKENGVVVCLWADPADIYERTKRFTHRPILRVDEPLKKIKELLETRRPYYERADYHVNTSAMKEAEVIGVISDHFDKLKKNR